jgi:hypothetical protein
MGRFDHFVGRVTCPECHTVFEPGYKAVMQTRIQPEPHEVPLGAGTRVGLPRTRSEWRNRADFIRARKPRKDEPVHLLTFWMCTACLTNGHWAEVVIDGDVIRSVESVDNTAEVARRMHYVSGNVYLFVPAVRALGRLDDAEAIRLLTQA